MGSGASSGSKTDVSIPTPVRKLQSFRALADSNLINLPVDGSDLKTFDDALTEVKRLRKFANEALSALHHRGSVFTEALEIYQKTTNNYLDGETGNDAHGGRRDAVKGNQGGITNVSEYKKKCVEKDQITRDLLLSVVSTNVLFAQCFEEEIQDIIDSFESVKVESGTKVINQGDQADLFYVIESGSFDVYVKAKGQKHSSLIEGATIQEGSAFGELALMYSKPRAATVVAREDSVVWVIDRDRYHTITKYFRMIRMQEQENLVGKIVIDGKKLCDLFTRQELEHVAMSGERDIYMKGDIIMRQGLGGDTAFVVQQGTVDAFKWKNKRRPSVAANMHRENDEENDGLGIFVKKLGKEEFFGEAALKAEDIRTYTYVAGEDNTVLLTLDRENVTSMIGSMAEIFEGQHQLDEADGDVSADLAEYANIGQKHCLDMKREDIELLSVLGAGAFGKVLLCKHKETKSTYAIKCQSKQDIVDSKLTKHVLTELDIMVLFDHPNIAMLHTCIQDSRYLYFVIELLQGGELFTHSRKYYKMEESWSKFYSGCVVLAYTQIHAHKVAYRDLKPENLVLDSQGYAKLVDFGLAKVVTSGKTWTICGTPDYLAPEIVTTEGHDCAVDFWALGVLIYELCAGTAPFTAQDPMDIYEKILAGAFTSPSHFSKGLKDILRKLLQIHQIKRLGNTKGGIHSIMTHKWYSGFDWEGLFHRKLKEKAFPIIPTVKDAEDANMFEPWDTEMAMKAPETDWFPTLPDMLTAHTKREQETMKLQTERMTKGKRSLLDDIKDAEIIRVASKVE
ncbi:hypothetical protein TrVE_jg6387 [Triparma verrucosa]|uniref:Uncharacterized protein n=1 Tax=Triparma verrucosa TaxID=1606542 RepID=A0A9W7CGC7_9STRA|nr:hypothetical protein TrVE_jg6387 [Triparma verrucosa]